MTKTLGSLVTLKITVLILVLSNNTGCTAGFETKTKKGLASLSESASANDLELFDKGAALYQQHCAICHGIDIATSERRGILLDQLITAAGPGGVKQMEQVAITDEEALAIVYALNNDRDKIIARIEQETGITNPTELPLNLKKRFITHKPMQYLNTLRSVAGQEAPTHSWPANSSLPLKGIDLDASRYTTDPGSRSIDLLDTQDMLKITGDLAKSMQPNINYQNLGCASATSYGDNCLKQVAYHLGQRAFRRPLSQTEADTIVSFVKQPTLSSEAEKMELLIQMVLMSPHTLGRTEIGDPSVVAANKSLTQYELANLISYSLLDMPPDSALLALASQGKLSDPLVIASEVKRLGNTAQGQKAAARFFMEYFRYERLEPDKPNGPTGSMVDYQALNNDVRRLSEHMMTQSLDGDAYSEVMTSGEVYVTKATAPYYGLSSSNVSSNGQIVDRSGERNGILTHPRWLMAKSHDAINSPVARGKFIREEILCGAIPSAPLVNFDANANPNLTLREKLAAHKTDISCKKCHDYMDDLGLPFEQFDSFGGYRTTELSRPVDATGAVTGSGNQDGAVANPAEMMVRLSQSSVARVCYQKHVMQYYSGMSSLPVDSQLLGNEPDTYNHLKLVEQSLIRTATELRE